VKSSSRKTCSSFAGYTCGSNSEQHRSTERWPSASTGYSREPVPCIGRCRRRSPSTLNSFYFQSKPWVQSERRRACAFRLHWVSFEEATVFEDALAVVHADDVHPERSLIVGTSDRNRLLLCGHTESEEEIRIISARRLTRREKKNYEEGT